MGRRNEHLDIIEIGMHNADELKYFLFHLVLSKFEFLRLNVKVHLIQLVAHYFMEREVRMFTYD